MYEILDIVYVYNIYNLYDIGYIIQYMYILQDISYMF